MLGARWPFVYIGRFAYNSHNISSDIPIRFFLKWISGRMTDSDNYKAVK